MELLSAHIINFGKLHDQDFDFKEGINSFQYENGWGKTTLSIFIKSMFYGMEYTSSKDADKNEKLKYLPWQGGIYGGSLNFSYKEKQYQIKRTFNLKKNEDTFELIDLITNKKSTDFSTDLGTELFGINRETYGRSVHVSLAESPAGSSDISAKLNNLIEAGDISNYDEAITILENKATSIKAKRGKNDLISNLQSKIDADRNYINEINSKIKQNSEYSIKIEEINSEIKGQKEKTDLITQELSKTAKYESKIRYEQLKEDVEKNEKEKKQLLEFFNGAIPSEETVKNIDDISSRLTTIESNIENQSATQSEINTYESLREYFAGDIPTAEQINNCLTLNTEYQNYKQKENSLKLTSDETLEFNSLKNKYSGSDINENIITEKINELDNVQKKKNALNGLRNDLSTKNNELTLAKAIKPKNVRRIICLFISLLFIIGGVVGFIIHNLILGIIPCGLAIVFLIIGLLSKSKDNDTSSIQSELHKLQEEISSLQTEIENNEKEMKLFISKYNSNSDSGLIALTNIKTEYGSFVRLNKKNDEYSIWVSQQERTPADFETEIKMFAKRYCKTEDISSITSDIQVLNEKLAKLNSLEKKINADSDNGKAQAEERNKLSSILNQYKTDKTLSFKDQVLQIHDVITRINNIDKQIADSKNAVLEFENDPNNDIASFSELTKPDKTVDELQNELSELSEEITEKNKIISDYQKIIDDNLTDTDKKEDVETEIDILQEEMKQATEENELLLKTAEFLKHAKEKLDANYSDPMKNGFNKYIDMLGGKLSLMINTDLEVSIDESGKTHESIYLSDGYKDMVNFCSRMALVDALFKDVKPPIILDDPFVNLDDDKVPKALKLVKDISKENQILYFACHKSREIQ